ncbi:MAG: dipeptidase [Acidobacteriaceae bacterium]
MPLPPTHYTKQDAEPARQSARNRHAAVHASALVIDAHADTPQRFVEESWDFTSPLAIADQPAGHLNLATARRGNLAAEFFALWPDPAQCPGARYALRTLTLLDAVREQVRRHPAELALCTSPKEILAARAAGKFAILLGIEGGHAIENSLALLRLYHALGVRYMTLTWTNSNDWADSSGDLDDPTLPHHNGLTPFGRQVIAEMNRLGMMVDLSHVSDRTFAEVLAVTRAPVLVSHSSARALTASHRNLTDDQLRALVANGGVCMVNFYPAFIDEPYRQAWAEQKPALLAAHKSLAIEYAAKGTPVPYSVANRLDREFAARLPRPPLSSLIAHFDHIISVAGIDHVGLGTDFDGICALPEGINSAADLPKLTAALLARGHSPADLHKLLGANLLRLFTAAQSAAIEPVAP